MWNLKFMCLFLLIISIKNAATECVEDACEYDEMQKALKFFEHENELLCQRQHEHFLAIYNYNTNVTEHNRQIMTDIATRNAAFSKELALKIKENNFERLGNEFVQRQAKLLGTLGVAILPEHEFKELQNAISAMQTNYATATVCDYEERNKCDLALEPHVQARLTHSRDPQELLHYWQQWHDKAGTPMRENFKKYVQLTRKASQMQNFSSYADYWIHFYDDAEFEKNLDAAYASILPFYKQVHAYVRARLRQHYGTDVVSATGNIPMHLLGNMWGQQWNEIMDLLMPFPKLDFLDVTAEMIRQNYTVEQLFHLGDNFFQSLNMRALPDSFWQRSVLTRATDREMICHASAWDLFQSSDVRIKMCTEVDNYYLLVVHHELGHIQYYLQYEQQPCAFRDAPNPGFHEAVGDVIALSVMTMKHLKRIGLTIKEHLDYEQRINELFKTALGKIVFLPFAYTMDKYRYAVFRDEFDENHWNSEFWKMRINFTGVEPPLSRSDADFDPPAKYHIDADIEYLRYFAAHIFQFQFHKALCIKANQYKPGDAAFTLDNCDIYNSKEAGAAFAKFLSAGASRNWREILQELTGETTMDTSALLEYFKPLNDWLTTENARLGVHVGWNN